MDFLALRLDTATAGSSCPVAILQRCCKARSLNDCNFPTFFVNSCTCYVHLTRQQWKLAHPGAVRKHNSLPIFRHAKQSAKPTCNNYKCSITSLRVIRIVIMYTRSISRSCYTLTHSTFKLTYLSLSPFSLRFGCRKQLSRTHSGNLLHFVLLVFFILSWKISHSTSNDFNACLFLYNNAIATGSAWQRFR